MLSIFFMNLLPSSDGQGEARIQPLSLDLRSVLNSFPSWCLLEEESKHTALPLPFCSTNEKTESEEGRRALSFSSLLMLLSSLLLLIFPLLSKVKMHKGGSP